MQVVDLGKGEFEVRGVKQEKSYYIFNKNGCSCGRKDCSHKKAVEEWIKKNF